MKKLKTTIPVDKETAQDLKVFIAVNRIGSYDEGIRELLKIAYT